VGKIAKKAENTVPYCQKYTPTDCVFGDFAHWVVHTYRYIVYESLRITITITELNIWHHQISNYNFIHLPKQRPSVKLKPL